MITTPAIAELVLPSCCGCADAEGSAAMPWLRIRNFVRPWWSEDVASLKTPQPRALAITPPKHPTSEARVGLPELVVQRALGPPATLNVASLVVQIRAL